MIPKKVKRLLMMTLIILVIIFTSITKDLKITKKKKANNELELEKFNKNIKFSKSKENKTEPYLEFNGQIQELSPLVSSDGRTITFETPLFKNVGDKAIIYYWITNENEESAIMEDLICEKEIDQLPEEKEEYIEIISKDELKNQKIKGKQTTKSSGSLEIILKKAYKGTKDKITYQITCKVNATKHD